MVGRISAAIGALLAVIVLALIAFLAQGVALNEAHRVFYNRLEDATALANRASTTAGQLDEESLQRSLARYDSVYGSTVVVLHQDDSIRLSSRPQTVVPSAASPAVKALLAGRPSRAPDALLPWGREPMTLGQVVIKNGDVIGAVVIVAPTDAARARIRRAWWLLGGLAAVSMAAIGGLSRLVALWMLGPVQVLGDTMSRIRSGELQARALATSWPPELSDLAASFNSMAAHVQAVIEAQSEFVANASHQLRNPLGALLMRLETLSEISDGHDRPDSTACRPDPEELSEATHRAVADGRHLAETLDGMLALARADRELRLPVELDVAQVVDARLETWAVVAAKRSITLRRTGSRSAMGLHDNSSLSSAIDSILDNALKFSRESSTVTVDLRTDPEHVSIVVLDQGPGVRPQDLAHLTDRFWRGRNHVNLPGSGLGMSIAVTLLERHGGRLEVREGADGGLEVHLKVKSGGVQQPRSRRQGLLRR